MRIWENLGTPGAMMNIYRHGTQKAETRIRRIINRGLDYTQQHYRQVSAIIKDVQKNGDAALEKYSNRFDAPRQKASRFLVTKKEMDTAIKTADRGFMRALNRAVRQVESFHRRQIEQSWISTERPGVVVGQQVTPVDSAGIYVPGAKGGETPLVSTVLMGAIPAKTAGVERVVMVTPPRKDGSVNPRLLVAAKKVGINEIYKVGSAWAIAALAYGTQTIPRVDMIAGPGNLYVALAKQILSGTVGIDMMAGPSEIMIIADSTANPRYIAADLLSQAEHDALSSAVLVTDSETIAQNTATEVTSQLAALTRQNTAEQALAAYGAIIVVDALKTAFTVANRFAPEHLELHVAEPFEWLGAVRNAGAVFLGDHTPEPVGDYVAGPNHTLPTAGCARFASALSTTHFMKKTSIVHYSKDAFKTEAADVIKIAETEGLTAHANAIKVRMASQKTQ
ncbi:MAG: histidinol dehydrogenase [Thermodesulfobacteriota bacterium]|nr:histidinol dehydrogenase [Thermodesulfobacteriota bacterium]